MILRGPESTRSAGRKLPVGRAPRCGAEASEPGNPRTQTDCPAGIWTHLRRIRVKMI